MCMLWVIILLFLYSVSLDLTLIVPSFQSFCVHSIKYYLISFLLLICFILFLVLNFIFYIIHTTVSNWFLFIQLMCLQPILSLICNNIHAVFSLSSIFVWLLLFSFSEKLFILLLSFIALELPNVLSVFPVIP